MVVGELVRLEDLAQEALSWTRPNFFALRYELAGSAGVVARISVRGIGRDRHLFGETAEGSWRLAAFPLNHPEVTVWATGEAEPIARYHRSEKVQVRFQDGTPYHFRKEGPFKSVLEDGEQRPVFTVEHVEAFPRWRAELCLEPDSIHLQHLGLLLVCAGSVLVFDWHLRGRRPASYETAVEKGEVAQSG